MQDYTPTTSASIREAYKIGTGTECYRINGRYCFVHLSDTWAQVALFGMGADYVTKDKIMEIADEQDYQEQYEAWDNSRRFKDLDGDHHDEPNERMPEHDYPY